MRKLAIPFGALVPLFLGLPLAAQDMPEPPSAAPPTAPAAPSVDMPAPAMNAEQKAQFDGWTAEQQALYDSWPGDVQAYYWSLPEPRQDLFWKLSNNDRVALTAMPPEGRADAWQLVERRINAQSTETPAEDSPR